MNMDSGSDDTRATEELKVRMLLQCARANIADLNPDTALAALIHAVKLTQGEDAIISALDRAKEEASANARARDIDDLEIAQRVSLNLVQDTGTVLYERGEESILKDAFEDGSSVVCALCKSLVPRDRFLQHKLYWCDCSGVPDMDV